MPSTGTRRATTPSPTSQIRASHAPTPKRFVGACSTMTVGSTTAPVTSVTAPAASGLSESSCTSHPRVHDGVEDVDQQVDEHVPDRDHGDEALDLLILPLRDRAEQLGAHTR